MSKENTFRGNSLFYFDCNEQSAEVVKNLLRIISQRTSNLIQFYRVLNLAQTYYKPNRFPVSQTPNPVLKIIS